MNTGHENRAHNYRGCRRALKRLHRPGISALTRGLLLCAGLVFFHGVQASDLNYVNARFSVEYNNQPTQGENRLKIQRDQNMYRIDFVLDHPLFSSSQKANFEMERCQVRPISYAATSSRPFKKDSFQRLAFDWDNQKVDYRSEEGQKSFDLNDRLYDPISFFFEARCGLIAGKKEFIYPLIRKGRITTHTYKVVGTQTVHTGQGDVKALVVERQRSNKKRQTRLYVAPALDYLLVKIEHQESRLVNITATLNEMDYELAAK